MPAQLFTADGAPPAELAPAWAAAEADDAGGSADAPPADGLGLPERVTVVESGVRFNVALRSGQKTGFYCDQRDNRARIRAAAAGARVLDLCCYSGGFAIAAALGGAASVTGVDSSAAAIALARENAALNGVPASVCDFVVADVLDFLHDKLASGAAGSYDIIILDPPKLAPNRAALPRAAGRYRRLNEAAARLVAPGGMLLSCSCSGAMTQSGEFPGLVADAAAAAGRSAALLGVSGAAQCHVRAAGYPESNYLTAVLRAFPRYGYCGCCLHALNACANHSASRSGHQLISLWTLAPCSFELIGFIGVCCGHQLASFWITTLTPRPCPRPHPPKNMRGPLRLCRPSGRCHHEEAG